MSEEWDKDIIEQEQLLQQSLLKGLSRRDITTIAQATGRTEEIIYRNARGENWTRITESTPAQEQAIRQYAAEQGYTDLRSFRSEMAYQEWDYYDVLRVFYGR